MQHTQTPWEWVDGECDEIESVQMLKGATGWIVYHHAAWPVSDDDKEFIVKACNNHEKFVQLAQMVAGKMYDDSIGHVTVKAAEELLDEMGVEYCGQ